MDVAIRDAMLPDLEAREFFLRLRAVGVTSVEVDVQPDDRTQFIRDDDTAHSVRDEASVRRLKRRLDDEGVRACALLLSTDFASSQADAHVETAVKAARAARVLGAPVVRIDPLVRDRSMPRDQARDRFVRGVEEVLRRTRDTGIDLGIENHGATANDPQFLDGVLAEVPDPRLGLTLDTGNFYWFGFPLEEVYRLVEKYAPATKHTHVKSINYPQEVVNHRREVGYGYKEFCCALDEGNLDLRRVVRSLRGAGYNRDLCVEDESLFKHTPERRVDVLRREVRALRTAIEETDA